MSFNEFKGNKIISEKDVGIVIFRMYENKIRHVEVKNGELVTMEIVEEGYIFNKENGNESYYNIYEFNSFSDVDMEVREWAAARTNNSKTIIDAIVISSLSQRILANFYISYHKPTKPTKVFTSIEKAFEWVEEMRLKDQLNNM